MNHHQSNLSFHISGEQRINNSIRGIDKMMPAFDEFSRRTSPHPFGCPYMDRPALRHLLRSNPKHHDATYPMEKDKEGERRREEGTDGVCMCARVSEREEGGEKERRRTKHSPVRGRVSAFDYAVARVPPARRHLTASGGKSARNSKEAWTVVAVVTHAGTHDARMHVARRNAGRRPAPAWGEH